MNKLVSGAQKKCYKFLLTHLNSEVDKVVGIFGEPGSGKTSLVCSLSSRHFDSRNILYLAAERYGKTIEESAIKTDFLDISLSETAELGVEFTDEVIEFLSEDSDLPFSKTIGKLGKKLMAGGHSRTLTAHEQRFIAKLLSGFRKPPIVVLDDIHYWDDSSLFFLHRILSGALNKYYKGLDKLKFVLIVSERTEDIAENSLWRKIVLEHSSITLRLNLPKLSEYGSILRAFGCKRKVTPDTLQDIYSLTGGNLALSKEVVEYINRSNDIIDLNRINQEETNTSQFFLTVLTKRLDCFHENSKRVRELLSLVSLLGMSASFIEAACALSWEAKKVRQIADFASGELDFVSLSESEISLSHETYRDLLKNFLSKSEKHYHSTFAKCLVKINPGDYARRAFNHFCAREFELGLACEISSKLDRMRNGGVILDKSSTLLDTNTTSPLRKFIVGINNALSASLQKQHSKALEELELLETSCVDLLDAEIAYLKAQQLVLLRDKTSLELSLSVLEESSVRFSHESEVCVRYAELKIVTLAHLNRWEAARTAEIELLKSAKEFSVVKDVFDTTINRLKRRSESIHPVKVANKKLKESLQYFGPPAKGKFPRNMTEYIATLNNLCANEMVCGNFSEAYKLSLLLKKVIYGRNKAYVRRIEIIWNNLFLAYFLKNDKVPDRIEKLLYWASNKEVHVSDFPILINNIASMLANEGMTERAIEILSNMELKLKILDGYMPYVMYLVTSNLSVLHMIEYRDSDFQKWTLVAKKHLINLDEEMKRYMSTRSELIAEYVKQGFKKRSLVDLDNYLQLKPRTGASWRFWGRSLVYSDLQFWSET